MNVFHKPEQLEILLLKIPLKKAVVYGMFRPRKDSSFCWPFLQFTVQFNSYKLASAVQKEDAAIGKKEKESKKSVCPARHYGGMRFQFVARAHDKGEQPRRRERREEGTKRGRE